MATIPVAETLALRPTGAQQELLDTLWRQAALLAVSAAMVRWVGQRPTRPVPELSVAIAARNADDRRPVAAPQAPPERMPLIADTTDARARQARLLASSSAECGRPHTRCAQRWRC